MKIRSLLLGTATALAAGGVAHAADLSVAEPVDYVRVCDAFGAGFFYAPGTDTCLSIGGFVRFDATYSHSSNNVGSSEYSSWNFTPSAYLTVTAKSMTDWGPLTGYFALYAQSDGYSDDFGGGVYYNSVGLDEAYISIGPLLAGYTESLWNYNPLLTIDNNNGDGLAYSRGNIDQIRLSWAMNGFGLAIGLEDPDHRSWQGFAYAHYGYSNVGPYGRDANFPDIVAALTASAGSVSGKLAFVYSDIYNDYYGGGGWAIDLGLTFKLDSLAPGDKAMLYAAYGDSAPAYVFGGMGASYNGWDADGDMWSVLGGFQHFFAPNLSTAIVVNYAEDDYDDYFWGVHWNVAYSPVKNLAITPELRWHRSGSDYYNVHQDDWTAMLRIERDFP